MSVQYSIQPFIKIDRILDSQPMPFPIEEKYIKTAEKKLSGRFSHHYRNQMMLCNGGTVLAKNDSWNLFPILNPASKKLFKLTCNDIVRETDSAKKWYGFPDNAIAIGENGGGDKLVFLRASKSKYRNEVYLWDHETTEMTIIAKSFSELKLEE